VFAGGRHIATYNNGSTYFNQSDWLGTERIRTLITGVQCETITSLPFGDAQATSGACGDPSPNHFTGKERDETGLDDFAGRYYSSAMGRFPSPDPLFASGRPAAPQTWNRYAYALNSPLTTTDPTGLYNWSPAAGGSLTDQQLEDAANNKDADKSARKFA